MSLGMGGRVTLPNSTAAEEKKNGPLQAEGGRGGGRGQTQTLNKFRVGGGTGRRGGCNYLPKPKHLPLNWCRRQHARTLSRSAPSLKRHTPRCCHLDSSSSSIAPRHLGVLRCRTSRCRRFFTRHPGVVAFSGGVQAPHQQPTSRCRSLLFWVLGFWNPRPPATFNTLMSR